jgi:multidrug efflux pump
LTARRRAAIAAYDQAEDYDSDVRYSGQTAVWMGIWPLPNANSLDVIKSVHSKMESIKKELPVGLDARVAYDATEYISHAISEVVKTLGDTLLIVVIFLFLGSFRSVLVPVVAISRWNSSWPRRPNPGRSWKSPKRCRKRR